MDSLMTPEVDKAMKQMCEAMEPLTIDQRHLLLISGLYMNLMRGENMTRECASDYILHWVEQIRKIDEKFPIEKEGMH